MEWLPELVEELLRALRLPCVTDCASGQEVLEWIIPAVRGDQHQFTVLNSFSKVRQSENPIDGGVLIVYPDHVLV